MSLAPGLLAAVPVDLGRAQAQQAAADELGRQIYREAGPGLLERALRWLAGRLGDVLDQVAGASPGGYAGVVVVVLLVVAAAVAIRLRVGPLARSGADDRSLFLGRELTATAHRALADRHAREGAWAEAVRERYRAIVRSLEERAVLEPRPGRTADEAASEAGGVLPTCAAGLADGARLFDEVWYGGRPAGPQADQRLQALDSAVAAARPAARAPVLTPVPPA